MIITIGRIAAVIRSPVAQAATSAIATSRSVMPCRLGRTTLIHPADSTGIATSTAAPPATRLDRYCASGNATHQSTATHSSPPAITASTIRSASDHFAAVEAKAPASNRSSAAVSAIIAISLPPPSFARSLDDDRLAATHVHRRDMADLAQNRADPVPVVLTQQTVPVRRSHLPMQQPDIRGLCPRRPDLLLRS